MGWKVEEKMTEEEVKLGGSGGGGGTRGEEMGESVGKGKEESK